MIPFVVYENDADRLSLRTLKQDSEEFWTRRAGRRLFVSASEVPTICGFGNEKEKSYRKLVLEKRTGIREEPSDFARMAMAHGKYYEPYAREEFLSKTALQGVETGMWVHPVDQRLSASPDALIWTNVGHVPLEIKCPYQAKEVTPERFHKDSLQLQTAIQCTGAPYGFLFYWFGHKDERNEYSVVFANPDVWHEIVALARHFIELVDSPVTFYLIDYATQLQRYENERAEAKYSCTNRKRCLDPPSAARKRNDCGPETARSGEASRTDAKRTTTSEDSLTEESCSFDFDRACA